HMRAEIGALHKRIGVTTVYVTHDQIEAMTMADRVVIMRDGAIQQIADPETLFQRPDNLFVAGFIGSPGMNFMATRLSEAAGPPSVHIFGATVPLAGRQMNGTTDLVAGLRPEHLTLGDGPVSFRVRPTLVESLGSEKYVYFDGGAHKVNRADETDEDSSKGLIARLSHQGRMAEGQEITLSFAPENLYLFDAKTEKAIR
ncbi:MAG: ABC transporter ATP-binding protein, partial [Candidatus Nanopelagicales bacterium]